MVHSGADRALRLDARGFVFNVRASYGIESAEFILDSNRQHQVTAGAEGLKPDASRPIICIKCVRRPSLDTGRGRSYTANKASSKELVD